jgi:NADH-quinone oxidoreductase subunit N
MSFSSAGYPLQPVLPELVLAIGSMVLLMVGAYRGQGVTRTVTTLAVCLLVLTGVLELLLPAGRLTTFSGSFIVDDFARFLKILALIGSVATLILSTEFLSDPSRRTFEYSILVLLSTLGMMVLISAGDLIMLYLGLELMSLALYVVAASNRDNAKSTEAGLNCFVLGAVVRHAALWRLADLWLYRHGQLCGHRCGGNDRQHRHRVRPGVPPRRSLLQGFGGAVPHVDARRL